MLSDWERGKWAGIERELTLDREFTRELGQLSERDLREVNFWRRFYPGAYLGGAVTYMLMAMGGRAAILGGLLLFGLVAWIAVEIHAARVQKSRTRTRSRQSR